MQKWKRHETTTSLNSRHSHWLVSNKGGRTYPAMRNLEQNWFAWSCRCSCPQCQVGRWTHRKKKMKKKTFGSLLQFRLKNCIVADAIQTWLDPMIPANMSERTSCQLTFEVQNFKLKWACNHQLQFFGQFLVQVHAVDVAFRTNHQQVVDDVDVNCYEGHLALVSENCSLETFIVMPFTRLSAKFVPFRHNDIRYLLNKVECHRKPFLPRETRSRNVWHLQKRPLWQAERSHESSWSGWRVADGCEHESGVERTRPNFKTPKVKRKPFAMHSGGIIRRSLDDGQVMRKNQTRS